MGGRASAKGETAEQKALYRLTGLDCPDCALTIEKAVRRLEGVREATVSLASSLLEVRYDPGLLDPAQVVRTVEASGYGASSGQGARAKEQALPFWRREPRVLFTAFSGATFGLGLVLHLAGVHQWWSTALFLAAMVSGGWQIMQRALASLRVRNLDINILMTLAVLGAIGLGEWEEGAAVIFLFALGNTLQAYTLDRAQRSIRSLMDLSPVEALVRRNGHLVLVPVGEIEVGEVILARPGEQIALDGQVVGGRSSVNQARITGESIPIAKVPGDSVYAGTINFQGALEIRVEKPAGETTLSRIVHLVQRAQVEKSPSQQFVDRFARYYTPAIMAVALGVATIPPLALAQPFGPWIYRALALLVLGCPCALVISTPVTVVAALANASRRGILIKSGLHLEEVGQISAIAFDKTGTLTLGQPRVTDVIPLDELSQEELLTLAAGVESHSEHPLADAILHEARHRGIDYTKGKDFVGLPGLGARANLGGQTYYVGGLGLLNKLSLSNGKLSEETARLEREGKTVLVLATEQAPLGLIAVADKLRELAADMISSLKDLGISPTVMLTGDSERVAAVVAERLGLDGYRAGLLPQDKLEAVHELKERHGRVAMVGDGVNDAPALATASVGIAMGVAGSDVALETADIALMSDELAEIPYVVALGRQTLRYIKENIALSLLLKIGILLLLFPGWLTLWLAVLGDMGTSLLVTLHGMQLLRFGEGKKT